MAVGQNCENCGAALGMGASFCRDCGASVRPVNDGKCRTCGSEIQDDAEFCGGCGTSLSAPIASGIGAASSELPMTSFIDAIKLGFSNYFTFSGRATRAEYWWFLLFLVLVNVLVNLITWIPFIGWAIWLASYIPSISLTTRRLHDIRKSGWWQLVYWGSGIVWALVVIGPIILFLIFVMAEAPGDAPVAVAYLVMLGIVWVVVTVAGIAATVVWIIWLVRKGDEGQNKYGPDPRIATSQQPYKP
jgi:uncharacterized membrane protein YhaH (DUF805 family)/ribosomal protein L40E